jgi:isoleucyl-tRNA synthetase
MAQFPTPDQFDLPDLEEDILDWWRDHDIFQKSISTREGGEPFTFYEGPPTANGKPGIHHVMARTIKDIFCRYKTMQGFQVARKAGWDTHGLPVEIEVEKELGLETRDQVEAYGIEKYNAACRESVLEYKDLWDELTERMGYWVDLDDPYVTFETDYIETVWWLLKQIHEKDLLYKGYKVQWYSPGSHTVLSSHEVSLGYEETQDPSVYIRFPVGPASELGDEDTYFLAWTTTPWTLIANTALAVGEDIPYVKIRHDDPHQGTEELILARELVDEVVDEDYEVVATYDGADLVGAPYEPVFDYFTDEDATGNAWHVVSADVVSTEEGTGVVHMAPAYGQDDSQVAKDKNLPLFNPIDKDGCFTDEAPLVEGQWFKDSDDDITDDLKRRGLLYKHESYLHNYPFDWRKGTPLMSYPVESWFIETTRLKDRMVELNETINWQPEGIGTGRFGEWLENNVDWALSRRRYWGTPLPVWESDKEGSDYYEVIGSVDELRAKCGDQLPEDDADIDLHRPFVDELTWEGPEGGTMRRVPDLIDVWFDSGSMPYAQWHYPFENEEAFEDNFPADFIAEGVDQTRGWFYSLHAIATLIFDDVAYENVVVNGLVLDADGNKMSKSKGNTVEPFTMIDKHGADVVRWFMMSNAPPWESVKFSERGLRDLRRKFFGTLENVYSFFATYANIDGFDPAAEPVPLAERTELDRWIISRLNTTAATVEAALDDYDPTTAARAVEDFVEELSNWYLRRSRRRFWAAKQGGDGQVGTQVSATSKRAAHQTVYTCLRATAELMSPIAPFFSEWLYQALTDAVEAADGDPTESTPAESVHLATFPAADEDRRNEPLERRMGLARTISSTALSLRNQAEINVRQPLPRILVVTGTGVDASDVEQVEDIIRDEVNVKAVDYVDHTSDVVRRSAKPNFSRLGPRLGELMKPVNEKVRQLGSDAIDRYVETGSLTLTVDGEEIELGEEDLEIQSEGIEGWLVEQRGGVTVALDTQVDDALRAEGLARESVKRVQNLRKDAQFDVTDRIAITYHGSDTIARAIDEWADWIRNETLALELHATDQPEGEAVETFHIDDQELTLGVRRVDR